MSARRVVSRDDVDGRSVVGVLLAAGRSDRSARWGPSALRILDGLPLVVHAGRMLRSHPDLADAPLLLAAPEADLDDLRRAVAGRVPGPAPVLIAAQDYLDGAVHDVLGQLDVALPANADPVLVLHDVRRACAPRDVLGRVLRAQVRAVQGAAVPVLELVETVKQLDGSGRIRRTLPREALARVQTPQAARLRVLQDVHRVCPYDAPIASLVGDGAGVLCVPGDERAMLIRDEADLLLALALAHPARADGTAHPPRNTSVTSRTS